MPEKKHNMKPVDWKALLEEDGDLLRSLVETVVQQVLEAEIREAVRMGRGQHRGNLLVLPPAGVPPQAHEIHQHAGSHQRRDKTTHPRRAHLPQRGQLPKADPGPGGGDARRLD